MAFLVHSNHVDAVCGNDVYCATLHIINPRFAHSC